MPATGFRRGEIVPKFDTQKSLPETPQGAKPSGPRPRRNLATSGRLMPWEQDSNAVSDVDSPKQRPSQSQAVRDRSKENFNNSTVITPRSKITGHLSLTPRSVLSPKTPAGVPKYSRNHQYDAHKQTSLPTCCDEALSNGCSPQQCVTQLMYEHNEVKTQLEAALLVCEVEEMGNTTHTLTAKEYEDRIHDLERQLATALEAVETVKLLDGDEGGRLQAHAISLEMKVAALMQEKNDLRLALDKIEERLTHTHSAWEMSVNREREARQMYDEASELFSIASLEKERAQERGSQMEGRLADAVNERERAVADMRAQRDEVTRALQSSNAAAALAQAVREEQEQKHTAEVEALQGELDRMRERSVFLEGNFGQVERHRIEEEQMADEKIERMREHMDRLSQALSEEQRRASKFAEEAKNWRGENEALLTEMEGLAARIEELETENQDLKQSLESEGAAHLEYECIDQEFETVEQELFRLHQKLDENQTMWQKRLDRAYQRLGMQPGQRLTPQTSSPKICTPTIRPDPRQTAASPLALYRAKRATPVAVDRATPPTAVGVPKGASPSAVEPADCTTISPDGTRTPTTLGSRDTPSGAVGDTNSLSTSVVKSSIAETAIQTGFPTAVGAVYLDMLSHYNTESSSAPSTCEAEGSNVSSTAAGLDEPDPAYLVTKNNILLMLSPRTSDGCRERSPYIIKYFSADMDDDKDHAQDGFTSSAHSMRHVDSPNSFARWMHSDNGEVGDAQFLEVLNGTMLRPTGWNAPYDAATRLPSNASSSSSLSSRTSQKPHQGAAAPQVMDDDFFIKLIKRPTPTPSMHHTTSISEAFTSTLTFLGSGFLGVEKQEKKKQRDSKPYKTNIVQC